jgi:hypothetical protein
MPARDDGTEFAPIGWSGRNADSSQNSGDWAMRSIDVVLRGLLFAIAGAILFAVVPAMAEDAAGPDKVKVGVFRRCHISSHATSVTSRNLTLSRRPVS